MGGSFHTSAEKVLIGAEGAYNAAASAELDAKGSGVLKGAALTRADDLRHQGYQALLAARTAYNAGAAPDVASITALTTQLLALVPKKGS